MITDEESNIQTQLRESRTHLPGPHIFVYGPPASGKTSTARYLAKSLVVPFVDLDAEIELRTGRSIQDIFEQSGEAAFRRVEQDVLFDLITKPTAVFALGGGALLNPHSRQIVESAGHVVCLSASPEVLLARTLIAPQQRPLLRKGSAGDEEDISQRLTRLLEHRRLHYASFQIQVDTTQGSPRSIAWQIQQQLGHFFVGGMAGMDRSGYPLIVQSGGLHHLGEQLLSLHLSGPVVVVADRNVAPLYAELALASLRRSDYQASLLSFRAGESHKTLATVADLWQGFIQAGLDRSATVVALGGGVTTDLAGFASATYLRGVNWVAVPTTLLAMADAAIGGKTGFDLPQGKNLVGAFYPPRLVLADPDTLHTLPERELISGLAEVVKSGLIADPELFELCCRGLTAETEDLEQLVRRSMAVKVRIVQADPYERGARAALNLGHTIGHALETASAYQLSHGEAISLGLVAEARLSEQIGLASPGLADKIAACLLGLGLPVEIPSDLSMQSIVQAASLDKKRRLGSQRFVLPLRPGRVKTGVVIPDWVSLLTQQRGGGNA